jgi:AraC-like DNA-binding protein
VTAHVQKKLELDFRAIGSGLRSGGLLRSSEVLGPVDDIFKAREHGYRLIDACTLLHVMNFEAAQPYSLTMARADLVCIQLTIKGAYNRWIGDRMDLVNPNMVQISNTPRSVSDTQAGARLRGLLIVCERQHLLDHFRLNADHIPPAYRPIFLSRLGTPDALKLPLSSASIALVDQILTCKYPEPLRGIFISAKTIEIICGIVTQIHALPSRGLPHVVGARSRIQAIELAADIYRREIGNPPTIEQLALRVGLNRNELTSGFRDAFGLTPHAYGHMLRMEEAQSLLRVGRISISEVARRVGYEGYSSFSRAYHAHYGHAPSVADLVPGE